MSNPTPLSLTKTRGSPSTTSWPIQIMGELFVPVNFQALLMRLLSRIRTSRLSPLTVTPSAMLTWTFRSAAPARSSSAICEESALTSTSSRRISPLVRRNSICRPSKTEVIRSLASRILRRFAVARLSSCLP